MIDATKLTTDRHEASRGVFATAELLVYRSLYIVDRRMVVVEGDKCPTPCKKEGNYPGGTVRGDMSGGKCPWYPLSRTYALARRLFCI